MEIYRAATVLPISGPPIRDGAVAVDDATIVAVGHVRHMPPGHVIDAGPLLMPGLVNAHTHLCYSAYADHYANGKSFFEWIQDFAIRNATMTEQDWRASARAGVSQSLRAGVTAVADVVTPPDALPELLDSGLSGSFYFEACYIDTPRWNEQRDGFLAVIDGILSDPPGDGWTLGISPHTLYTLGTAVGQDLGRIARERGLRLHPHLAETVYEDAYVRAGEGAFSDVNIGVDVAFELLDGGCGASPAVEMDRWGLLGVDSHVAHGVHLDAADRALLRDRGTAVALCPRSNDRLGAGEAPVAAYRAERHAVAVGTDSLASSPDLDVAAELPVLRDLAVKQGDAGDGLDEWLVRAATLGGAEAMGRRDFGALEPGTRANLAAFDVDAGTDPYAAVVDAAGGACVATVLGGRAWFHDE